tara:strand:+ start:454 stop:924 length:471 start_codon:yes stop_codon:yes gene_type:complete
MKPKIPTIKVLSDECAINVGQVIEDGEITEPGIPHYVHEGEWVEVLPVMSVREVMSISRLQTSASDSSKLGENLTSLCNELSHRIIAWNWTDIMGEPMEQPYNRADVLEGLSSEELMWLMTATGSGESADARKKDSKKSESISLETDGNQTMLPSE